LRLFSDLYYIEEDYVPPSIWASASSDTSLATNACESLHSGFNSNFYHNYYTIILKIIEVLKTSQTNTYIKIRTSDFNGPQEISKKKKKNKSISILKY